MSIDRYDPIRVIGEGSFGKVYLMRDKAKRSFACVKIIKIKNIPKKEREATKVEVDLLRRLNHPNIVRYLDSFLSNNKDSLCIAMEYCDGGDLATQIKAARKNLFSESKILHWFVQLALGLHYMHNNKVLHRDLKTQNIFMLGNGRLVLGDLGISKVLDGTMDFAQTCIGTPYYMSPEIFKNKPYSFKSDIWALGCVLYEMTTLNHAFDANSLNGLATKIVKGKYPPIHAKYSRYLRELIGQMLLIEPKQRPDLDQILRKPFIKKHIINFFSDIASRPSASIGEGTMIMKAAAGGGIAPQVSNDTNMLSLQKQLSALGMNEELQQALNPQSNVMPIDDGAAIKLAREQASALKREQDHKKMVEAALEKLRQERENRVKQKDSVAYNNGVGPSVGPDGRRRVPHYANPVGQPRVRGGANWHRPSPQYEDSSAAASRAANAANAINAANLLAANAANAALAAREYAPQVGRRKTFDDERANAERAKKLADDRKREMIKQQQDVEAARLRVEEKKREEHMQLREKAQREEAKVREEARKVESDRLKKVDDEKKKQEQSNSRREVQREKERARQKEEIEQLRRDKLELDRRTNERERIREERRLQERARLDGQKETDDSICHRRQSSSDEKSFFVEGKPARERAAIAEAKGIAAAAANDNAAFAGNRRHAERQAKEEAERMEAVREAERIEEENRRAMRDRQGLGQHPSGRAKNQLSDLDGAPAPSARSRHHSSERSNDEKYEFDPSKPRQRNAMDEEQMNSRLAEINNKGASRYNSGADAKNDRPAPTSSSSQQDSKGSRGQNDYDYMSDDSNEDDDELNADSICMNDDEQNVQDEMEDIYKREEELRAELNNATLRCNELRQSLQATKSFLGPRLPTRGKTREASQQQQQSRGGLEVRISGSGDGEEEEEEDEESDFEDSDNDVDSVDDEENGKWGDRDSSNHGHGGKPPTHPDTGSSSDVKDQTIRRLRTPPDQNNNNKNPNRYIPMQDAPSPSGRLADRIERLRDRCKEALGISAFEDAYSFLKHHEEESQGYENGRDMNDDDYERRKILKLRGILGEQKAHYGSLIEQLIFMEDTHGPG